jgi:endonuclease/exonuclease/phosphatase (EEP) superfamily protein YafD
MKKTNIPKISALTCFLTLLTLSGFIYFSGCVVIQDQAHVVQSSGSQVIDQVAESCDQIEIAKEKGFPYKSLAPDNFSILSWNIHKGSEDGFHSDLKDLSRNIDILLLQEAALSGELENWLGMDFNKWLLAVAFEKQGTKIGIMAASKASSLSYCAFQEPEPIFLIPKMMLVSTYPLAGVDRRLLVVNAHMVNFTVTSEVVRKQLAEVAEIIEKHDGPVIVAGDFNTWNSDRESAVQGAMSKLNLQPVAFSPDNRSLFMNRTVDGIFYRGLEVTASNTHLVESSDHNPLEVQFKLAEQ